MHLLPAALLDTSHPEHGAHSPSQPIQFSTHTFTSTYTNLVHQTIVISHSCVSTSLPQVLLAGPPGVCPVRHPGVAGVRHMVVCTYADMCACACVLLVHIAVPPTGPLHYAWSPGWATWDPNTSCDSHFCWTVVSHTLGFVRQNLVCEYGCVPLSPCTCALHTDGHRG